MNTLFHIRVTAPDGQVRTHPNAYPLGQAMSIRDGLEVVYGPQGFVIEIDPAAGNEWSPIVITHGEIQRCWTGEIER